MNIESENKVIVDSSTEASAEIVKEFIKKSPDLALRLNYEALKKQTEDFKLGLAEAKLVLSACKLGLRQACVAWNEGLTLETEKKLWANLAIARKGWVEALETQKEFIVRSKFLEEEWKKLTETLSAVPDDKATLQ
ncbi:MAG: hypothetical protein KKD92_14005 [Proteobacteria bacterium]|nr:hypothetical protein [Pseudomonadota bacterium]